MNWNWVWAFGIYLLFGALVSLLRWLSDKYSSDLSVLAAPWGYYIFWGGVFFPVAYVMAMFYKKFWWYGATSVVIWLTCLFLCSLKLLPYFQPGKPQAVCALVVFLLPSVVGLVGTKLCPRTTNPALRGWLKKK